MTAPLDLFIRMPSRFSEDIADVEYFVSSRTTYDSSIGGTGLMSTIDFNDSGNTVEVLIRNINNNGGTMITAGTAFTVTLNDFKYPLSTAVTDDFEF